MTTLLVFGFVMIGCFVTLWYDWFSCKKNHMTYDPFFSVILCLTSWFGILLIMWYENRHKRD